MGSCKAMRIAILVAAATSAAVPWLSSVDAAIVEATTVTTVSVEAMLFDTKLAAANGCDPAGCTGDLTRDGDWTSIQSRWSCKPELGPAGSSCSITYSLGDTFTIEGLKIAMYKGDTRSRTIDIFINGNLYSGWTSSGTTADLETVQITGIPGNTIELRGVLSDSEWLSIKEVEILVDDDSDPTSVSSAVEAGTLGPVVTTAPIYDTNLASEGGCDPAGCTGELTRDGLATSPSRWSCAPKLGGTCTITFDLGTIRELEEVRLAMYKGTTRSRTMDVYIDGLLITTWTSSGTTDSFETVDVSGASGQELKLQAVLSDSEWISITEVEMMVLPQSSTTDSTDDDPPTSTPTPQPVVGTDPPSTVATASPIAATTDDDEDDDGTYFGAIPVTRTTADGQLIVEAGEISWVELSYVQSLNSDDRLAADGGCDPTGCNEDNTRDGSLDPDSRWSCQYEARDDDIDWNCRIAYDLGGYRDLESINIAFYQGDTRSTSLAVFVDDVLVVDEWTSSGATLDFQSISLDGWSGQEIILVGILADAEWMSITEVEIDVIVDDVPLWGVSAAERITVLASASSGDPDPILDGVIGAESSWSCAGTGCSVVFDLEANQAVEQISMSFVESGDISDNIFDVSLAYSATGGYTELLSDIPSNKDRALSPQQWKIDRVARFVRIEASSLGSGSLHISEMDIRLSENVPVHPTTVDSSLSTIGLLPLADGNGDSRTEAEGGCGTDGCIAFYAKDGNPDTYWRCYGSPTTGDSTYYDCTLGVNLLSYRKLKQIKIALPDGAERATEMRFAASKPSSQSDGYSEELSVISSGETDGLETYDFDHFTKYVRISGRFRNINDFIAISEVQFLEEPDDATVPVYSFNSPYDNGDGLWNVATTEGFEWQSDADEALERSLSWSFASYATVTAIELKFPAGDSYQFDLNVYAVDDSEPSYVVQSIQSDASSEDFQSFEITMTDIVTLISITMQGTVGAGGGFKLLDARILGTTVGNPTNLFYVGSTAIDDWEGNLYPDFVSEGTGDQKAIMAAICAVKKSSFDGVDCVGEDATATGSVFLPMGEWHVNGNIFMKSGVELNGRYSIDDSPYTTDILLEEDAAGSTDVGPIIVFDGVENARIEDLWIRGLYDPDTSNADAAVAGLGSTCLEITNSKNITLEDTEIRYCDGDGLVMRSSSMINVDAGGYDDEYLPWTIGSSRGTGMVMDDCDSVWVRRHTFYNNGVAGIHIIGSNNFTFEATIGGGYTEGEGNVGSIDGQQPIEIVIESSSLLTFQDMKVTSENDPIMTVSSDSSSVVFNNLGLSSVPTGNCVIQAGDTGVITVVDDELNLEGDCFVKVDSGS